MSGRTKRARPDLKLARNDAREPAEEPTRGSTGGHVATHRLRRSLQELADLHVRMSRAYQDLAEDAGIALDDLEVLSVTAVAPVTDTTKQASQAPDSLSKVLSQPELASLLGCHPRTVRRMELAGELPRPTGTGRLKRWRRSEIEALLDEGGSAK